MSIKGGTILKTEKVMDLKNAHKKDAAIRA
jgi:hypothetical protein